MRTSAGSKFLPGLLALLGAAAAGGCRTPQDPSDELRHASYAWCEGLFTGSKDAARRQTYIVFSGGPRFKVTLDPRTGVVHGDGDKRPLTSGLAVALEPDGYLVTVAHVLDKNVFVLGWFEGRLDLKPATVVFQRDRHTDADFALIKVDGKPDHCAVQGQRPAIGDRVFAIACYRNDTRMAVDFAAGKVLGMAPGATEDPLNLIETDVPVARGDSGGPLLARNGQLIGINTLRKKWTYSFYPDPEFIRHLIEEDRSSRAKPLPEARPVHGGNR